MRRLTALRDWIAAIIVVGSQQFTPLGVKLTTAWFAILLGIALTAVGVAGFVYPRLNAARFLRVEIVMVTVVWIATALIVYASGGARSPYIFFFAQSMIYVAYFVRRSSISIAHIAIGSLAAAAPIVYDHQAAMAGGFVPTIAVALAVWWAICAVIAVKRRATIGAEELARRMALTDPLTDVGNVRALEEYAAGQSRFAVAIVDLDGLKRVNTSHGHAGGDALIRRMATALVAACGEDDQVARIGGDEFAVLMPGADAESVSRWSRRFSAAVTAGNMIANYDAPELAVSIGTAQAPDDGSSLYQVMDAADQRMYQQKTVPSHGAASADAEMIGEFVRGGRKSVEELRPTARASRLSAADLEAPAGPWVAVAVAASMALAIGFTGGSKSIFNATVLVAVAYFAYFGGRRQAIFGGAVTLAGFAAGFFATGADSLVEQTRFTTLVFCSFVIGYALVKNGQAHVDALQRVDELSERDALSGIRNRWVFERDLRRVLIDAAGSPIRRHRPVLMLADLDNFKNVNTLLGHVGGDALIRAAAAALTEAVGRHGAVYRIGGDEFALLLPSEMPCDAEPFTDRCAKHVRLLDRDGEYTRNGVDVGASIGYAVWRPGMTGKQLMREADRVMMAAKLKKISQRAEAGGAASLRAAS